jgi:ribosomal protein S27AE
MSKRGDKNRRYKARKRAALKPLCPRCHRKTFFTVGDKKYCIRCGIAF